MAFGKFVKSHRKNAGKADIVLFSVIGLVIAAGFVFFILKILGHSEEHVKKVKKTKVRYEESLTWRPDTTRSEKRINADYVANPNRKSVNYKQLNLSEKAFKLIAKMKRLELINLHQCKLEDKDLKYLENLPLKTLNLNGASITDKSIKYILGFKDLETLFIGDCDITDEGLKELASNTKIKSLSVELNKNITNDGVKYISEMSQLKDLDLSFTGINGTFVNDLIKLRKLVTLDLEGIKIRAVDLKELNKLRRLNFLKMQACGLTDSELVVLGNNPRLKKLILNRNLFTDEGLSQLEKVSKLHLVLIKHCPNLTEAGIEQFKKARPDCRVVVGQSIFEKYAKKKMKPEVELLQSEATDILDTISK